MLSGASVQFKKSSVMATSYSIHPVQSLSSISTLYMVSTGSDGSNKVQLYSITGSVPSTSVSMTNLLLTQTINFPPSTMQLGTSSFVSAR